MMNNNEYKNQHESTANMMVIYHGIYIISLLRLNHRGLTCAEGNLEFKI